MYIYVVVLLISLLFASMLTEVRKMPVTVFNAGKYTIKKEYAEYILLILSMAPFILLSGLRYSVGADYFYTYTKIFDNVANGLSFAEVNGVVNCEIGYYLLNKIIVMLGGGYVWVFMITSAIIIGFFWTAFYQQSDNLCLSITMFFCAETFFISLCYVRQFMALAIVFYRLKYLKTDKKSDVLKFFVFVAIAFTIHKSAVIMLPWFIAYYVKIRPEILVLIIAFVSLFKDGLVKVLNSILSFTPYAYYIGSVYQSHSRFYSTRPVAYIAVFIIAWLLYKKYKGDRQYAAFLNTLALLILITVNFDIMPQMDRITWYFESVLFLAVPYLIKRIENNWLKNIVTAGLIAMFSIFTYHSVVVFLAHGVLPYRFVFAPSMVIH